MNYTLQRITNAFLALVFSLLGASLGLGALSKGDWLFGIPALGIPMFVVWWICYVRIPQINMFERMNYTWYKETHPLNVTPNGVTCHACGSRKIHVRALMRQTYHLAHMCGQCGETLYYTPEK